MWRKVFWILVKQWNPNVFSFKWFEIWYMFIYYECVGFWRKFKNKFSIVSIEQSMRKKKIDFKFWYIKQFDIMVIRFDVRLSKTHVIMLNSNWLAKTMDCLCGDQDSNPLYQQLYVDYIKYIYYIYIYNIKWWIYIYYKFNLITLSLVNLLFDHILLNSLIHTNPLSITKSDGELIKFFNRLMN